MSLKLSPFLHIERIEKDSNIVTDIASGAVVELNSSELADLASFNDPTGVFLDYGFLVSDEKRACNRVIERHRIARKSPASLNIMLLPTLSCNFACTYCFEHGSQPTRMNDTIADSILEYVRHHAPNHLRVDLSWFGGEPLLELDRIISLHPVIRNIAQETGCEFFCDLTTNGYLLDRHASKTLDMLGIRHLQVTVDGNKDVHNAQRPTRDGKETFDQVIENIIVFLELCPTGIIQIRVNSTVESIETIIDVLETIPMSVRSRLVLHIHPIMSFCSSVAVTSEFVSRSREVYRRARAAKYSVSVDHYMDPGPAVYCYAERETSVVIDPRGWVYKCAYTGYDEQERIGVLQQDGTILQTGEFRHTWKKLCDTEPAECLGCNYLPICGCGCPRLRMEPRSKTLCRERFINIPDTLRGIASSHGL